MSFLRPVLIPRIRARVDQMQLPFNRYGLDHWGISKDHLAFAYGCIEPIYREWFRVQVEGIENVPGQGRAMLVGNHSGGLPFDAMLVLGSMFFEMEPPRLAHGMVEKLAQNWPVASPLFSRIGQFAGLPEHAVRLLEDDRILMVYPEGVRGLGKLHTERYELARFGTGFVRIALESCSPIVPFGVIGAEEAYPVVARMEPLARLMGLPYIPVPSHMVPVPLPRTCTIRYGEPLYFEGTGHEGDEVIAELVEQVKARVDELIAPGREESS